MLIKLLIWIIIRKFLHKIKIKTKYKRVECLFLIIRVIIKNMIFIKIMMSNYKYYLKIKKEKDNPKFFKLILMDGKYILLKN